jgi:hypothetical protein
MNSDQQKTIRAGDMGNNASISVIVFRQEDYALSGGVTRSLSLDIHGKSLSSSLLDMDLEET